MHYAFCEICKIAENGRKNKLSQIDPFILFPLDDDLHHHVSYKYADNAPTKILMYDQRNHIRQWIDRGHTQIRVHGKGNSEGHEQKAHTVQHDSH